MNALGSRGSNRLKMLLSGAALIGLALGSVSLAQSSPADKGAGQSASVKPPASQPANATSAHEPEPYDLAAIDKNPKYYSTVNAARVYQQAPVPAGQKFHPHLEILSGGLIETVGNKTLDQPIVVKAQPGRPVTFVALDEAKFSGQDSITVKAGPDGKASATLTVGAPGHYRVLVGSPENEGPEMIHVEAFSAADFANRNNPDPKRLAWDQEVRAFEAQRSVGAAAPPASQPARATSPADGAKKTNSPGAPAGGR